MDLHRLAANANLACVRPVNTKNHPGNLGSSRPDQARKPKDLAPSYLEADIRKYPLARQVSHIEHDFSRLDVALGIEGFQCAPDHLTDDLLGGQFRDGRGGNARPIAKDGDTVGQFKYFLQAVTDEEDGDSALAQLF